MWQRVASMASGMDTVLYKDLSEKGVEVSGGEAQKLAIARALYRDSAFLILDEPTAALDPLSEYEIYARLSEIVEDKTQSTSATVFPPAASVTKFWFS